MSKPTTKRTGIQLSIGVPGGGGVGGGGAFCA